MDKPLCPEHNIPLVRHEIKNRDGTVEYCWDCPGKMTKSQQVRMNRAYPQGNYNDDSPCFYHVHED